MAYGSRVLLHGRSRPEVWNQTSRASSRGAMSGPRALETCPGDMSVTWGTIAKSRHFAQFGPVPGSDPRFWCDADARAMPRAGGQRPTRGFGPLGLPLATDVGQGAGVHRPRPPTTTT